MFLERCLVPNSEIGTEDAKWGEMLRFCLQNVAALLTGNQGKLAGQSSSILTFISSALEIAAPPVGKQKPCPQLPSVDPPAHSMGGGGTGAWPSSFLPD